MVDPKRRIGGSMIAKILKKSKWGTPLDAYLELTDPTSRVQTTSEDKDRGIFLEPAIRDWTNYKLAGEGLEFSKPNPGVLVYPEWDWATVSPDGLVGFHPAVISRSPALLEIKAPRRDDIALWGEEGSDEVPTDALLQTHWGLMVTDAEEGVVAALLGGELRIFRVKRDPALEKVMLERAKEFVECHVLPGVPPEATFGDDRNVRQLFPADRNPHIPWNDLTETQRQVVGEYLATYAEAKRNEKALGAWEPQIKMLIGEASGITCPLGRIDWKANKTAATKWKALAEYLMEGRSQEEVEALVKIYAGEPARPLVPRIKESKP